MAEGIDCQGVWRSFAAAAGAVLAVRGVTFSVEPGALVALVGPSGSGKTTLLSLAGGLDRPDQGTVTVAGRELGRLSRTELVRFRRELVGFVFQSPGLIPLMTALENVSLTLELLGRPEREVRELALDALELVGLESRARHRAYELSGGEQQRVALARALAKAPRVLLADEPTGELDSETGQAIVALLREVSRSGTAVLVATHDEALAAGADRVYRIEDGALVG